VAIRPTTRVRNRLAFAAAAEIVVGLDQLTKQLALTHLADGPTDLPGSFRLVLTFNDSAAFNVGGGRTSWIAALALVVAVGLAVIGLRAERRPQAIGWGVVVGGAAGNLVDRVLRDGNGFLGGRVVDFIDPGFWPVFNVADASLWVGIGILLVASLREERRDRPADGAGAGDGEADGVVGS
jgi:signal peptidase II